MAGHTGPYGHIRAADGLVVPWYIMPFDKRGINKAPQTTKHLLDAIANHNYTHIFFFSHGWNNDWNVATKRYQEFANGFMELRASHGITTPNSYKPLLLGIQWPSTSLILPWERGLTIATVQDEKAKGILAGNTNQSVDLIVEELPIKDTPRFYELTSLDGLTRSEALELASLVLKVSGADNEFGTEATAQDLADAWWQSQSLIARFNHHSNSHKHSSSETETRNTADTTAFVSKLDPRHALRMLTVWKMKDRAGTVGSKGVSQLLANVLAQSSAKIHMIGHSYGCKVVLSALLGQKLKRPVESALLLQPALSQRAFAADATGQGQEGGYRQTLALIRQPVISTYSRNDVALRLAFHLAVRRKKDIGELVTASTDSPSRYAALGGYGPWGVPENELTKTNSKTPGQQYQELLAPGAQIIGLDSSAHIDGHGDVSNPATYWALHEQVRVSSVT